LRGLQPRYDPVLHALIIFPYLITNTDPDRVDVTKQKAEVEAEERIVVYSFYIWRSTSPGKGASNAEIVRQRSSLFTYSPYLAYLTPLLLSARHDPPAFLFSHLFVSAPTDGC